MKLYLDGTQLKYTETDDTIYGVYCDQGKYKYVCHLDINTNQAKIREYVCCNYTLKHPTLLENEELSISVKNLKFIKLGIKTDNIPWIMNSKTKEITAHTTHKIRYYDTDFNGPFRIVKVELPYYVKSSEYDEVLKIVQTALKKIMPEAHVRIHIFSSNSITKDYLIEL